jgi:hypothetical protein
MVSVGAWLIISHLVRYGSGFLEDSIWGRLGAKALIDHIIVHGKQSAKQIWGQLMGEPMSFPILCIINAAGCIVGAGLKVEDVLMKRGPLVVNGDDVGMILEKDRYENWCKVVTAIGLSPSVGKNYLSRDFLIMNSELRIATIQQDGHVVWKRQGFLNQSLLFSMEKKGTEAGRDNRPYLFPTDLGAICSQLLEFEDLRTQKIWRKWFCDWHADVLKQLVPGISRFLSPDLGGAGIPILDSEVTLEERRVAAAIANRDPIPRPKQLRKGWLSKDCSDCEAYYKQFLPVIVSETSKGDLQSEMRGQTVHVEKTSLGSRIRLAYTLAHFLAELPNALPDVEVPHPYEPTSLIDTPAVHSYELKRWQNGLWAGVRAAKHVADHEKTELIGGSFCICCRKQALHPMDAAHINCWKPPEEELIQWGLLQHSGLPLFPAPLEYEDVVFADEVLRLSGIKLNHRTCLNVPKAPQPLPRLPDLGGDNDNIGLDLVDECKDQNRLDELVYALIKAGLASLPAGLPEGASGPMTQIHSLVVMESQVNASQK